jgi:hypothetical protein
MIDGYSELFDHLLTLMENDYDKAVLSYLRDHSLNWLTVLDDIGINPDALSVDDLQRIRQVVKS